MLGDVRRKLGFELDQQFGAFGGFLLGADGSGAQEKEQQKGYGDPVHRKLSGRSGGE